jgi:DNA-binding transcriptional LysR family regulator
MEDSRFSFAPVEQLKMADLNEIAIFVKVAQFESFSKAARSMGMPVSTVSRAVSNLETELGVTLLQRTTRQLTLTSQGRVYFNECQAPLDLLIDAERVLTQAQQRIEGTLKISVPVILGQEIFLSFVSDFLKKYPQIKIDLLITNQFVDLIAENVDLAIRFGDLSDSSVVAKRLGVSVRYLVAAPQYLKGRRLPLEPDDLKEQDCVLMNGKHNEADWDLVNGRKKIRVHVSGPISSRDFNSASVFTYRGHGIGLLPSTYCDVLIERGDLIRVLPAWSSAAFPVHAVYPTRKFLAAKLHAFLAALVAWKSPLWLAD